MRLLLLSAIVALIVGIVVTAVPASRPATFGWFEYSPLSSANGPLDGLYIISTTGVVGVVILGVGLMALAFWAGLRVARRQPRIKE